MLSSFGHAVYNGDTSRYQSCSDGQGPARTTIFCPLFWIVLALRMFSSGVSSAMLLGKKFPVGKEFLDMEAVPAVSVFPTNMKFVYKIHVMPRAKSLCGDSFGA